MGSICIFLEKTVMSPKQVYETFPSRMLQITDLQSFARLFNVSQKEKYSCKI